MAQQARAWSLSAEDSLNSAQDSVATDSTKIKPAAAEPLLKQWVAQSPFPAFPRDSLLKNYYRFNDLLLLNYTGLTDVFRNAPDMQAFDFLEMGLPRFTSDLHLWPQQTRFYWDDFEVNDPITGMFSTRLLFPDALQQAAPFAWQPTALYTGQPETSGGVGLYSRMILKEKPYTRLMYREGDFGYTDLDITFARFLDSRTAVQLGGVNRDYSPNGYRGTHYRGLLTREISRHLVGRFFYRKSSENVTFRDVYGTEFGVFRYNEVWELFRTELLHLNDARHIDWQIRALFNDSRRAYRFSTLDQQTKLRFDRLVVQGIYNRPWKFGTLNMLVESGQNKIWGNVFDRKYTDSYLNLKSATRFRLPDSLRLTAALNLNAQWGQPWQLNPALYLNWQNNALDVQLSAEQSGRFPCADERFFNFNGIGANRKIAPERHRELRGGLLWKTFPWNHNRLALVYHHISDEILFTGKTFVNGADRDFAFLEGQSAVKWYKFGFYTGGQVGLAGALLGPDYSAYGKLTYHDRWLKGHLIIDAAVNVKYLGARKQVAYQPFAERFYRVPGKTEGFFLLNYKIVATVKDARLFMEMDNPFAQQYEIIRGYPELYRRLRFGVSWVLWN